MVIKDLLLVIKDLLRQLLKESTGDEPLPKTWWDKTWPAWFGSGSMMLLQVAAFCLDEKYQDKLEMFWTDKPRRFLIVAFLLLFSFASGCLFSKNRRLTRLRRCMLGATVPIFFILIAFSWRALL